MKTMLTTLLMAFSIQAKADIVIDKMGVEFQNLKQVEESFHQVAEELIRRKDSRGIFVKVYEVITKNIQKMLDQKRFEDPKWVKQVGLTYANYFRRVFFSYEFYQRTGSFASPMPHSWWLAFEENRREDLSISVQLILAVSAHIQNDLPSALIESGADFTPRCRRDYVRIGQVFAGSFEDSWQAIARFEQDQRFYFRELIGSWMGENWIEIFRANAWENALKLKGKQITVKQIDQAAVRSGYAYRTIDFWVW